MKNGEYELVVAPEEYPGKKYRGRYVLEHHLVWWKEKGEVLKPGEVIHHINGKKRDNRFSNLEKMASERHSRMHKSTGKTMSKVICSNCGKHFEREKRLLNSRYKNYYCNRSCMGKKQAYSNLHKVDRE